MLTLSFNPFPTLTTPRLTLRRLTPNYVNDLFALRSNPEAMRYIARPLAQTPDDAAKLISVIDELWERNEAINWAIALKDADEMIGTFCFWNIQPEDHRAEIGYMLHPSHQGVGIMQETMTAALNYGFNTMKLHSIAANVDPRNTASIKLLERNGFTREAYFRENVFFNDQYLDTAVYGLLAP
ncbi:MAG TPA: GNAT family protein [Chitinophagales bacterium]|nr:GNAT family protein [Chitinophagales bacterium]